MTHVRRLAKGLGRWAVPRGFHDLAREWLISKRASSDGQLSDEERHVLDRNRELQNRHRGERCFILATGPSIKRQHLKPLKDEICISVSNFFVHPDYLTIRPRYHCIAPYHPPITEDAWQTWMTETAAATSAAGATMLFGIDDRERNERCDRYRGRQVHYLKFVGPWDGALANGIDLTKALPPPASVSIMALMAAIYMGFRDVYLLGCDHDWILHLNESRHFYEESAHALVRSQYDEWAGTDFELECGNLLELFRQYRRLMAAARACGTHIHNATAGGLLDAVPRVRLERVLDASAARSAS